jgi:hypothetical protein
MFLKGHKSLQGFSYYLRFAVVCNILGLQNFRNVLKGLPHKKSLRTPAFYSQYEVSCFTIKIEVLSDLHIMLLLEVTILKPNPTKVNRNLW